MVVVVLASWSEVVWEVCSVLTNVDDETDSEVCSFKLDETTLSMAWAEAADTPSVSEICSLRRLDDWNFSDFDEDDEKVVEDISPFFPAANVIVLGSWILTTFFEWLFWNSASDERIVRPWSSVTFEADFDCSAFDSDEVVLTPWFSVVLELDSRLFSFDPDNNFVPDVEGESIIFEIEIFSPNDSSPWIGFVSENSEYSDVSAVDDDCSCLINLLVRELTDVFDKDDVKSTVADPSDFFANEFGFSPVFFLLFFDTIFFYSFSVKLI